MIARRLERYAAGLHDDGVIAQALGDEQTAGFAWSWPDRSRRSRRTYSLTPPVPRAPTLRAG